MPVIRWGTIIKQKLSKGSSRFIDYYTTGNLDCHSWTVKFSFYIDCTYQNGRYDENGAASYGYAAEAAFIETSRNARYQYAKRIGIEASHRLFEQNIATTRRSL